MERFFINMPIPADKFEAVCAVLAGGAAVAALASGGAGQSTGNTGNGAASQATVESSAPSNNTGASEPGGNGSTATSGASPSDAGGDAGDASGGDPNEVDAHGHPWSAELHAGTKGKTKDGLWRMKVGVSRPDPKPGFPLGGDNAGNGSDATGSGATASVGELGAGAGAAPAPAAEEEDEFAAFRAASENSAATDAAAASSVPVRQYSDADLGALCNQAAVKLGDPQPVKDIIAKFVPAGEVAHSRNIPADKRGEFVKEVETKAGIEFAG